MRSKPSLLHSITRMTIGGIFVALDEVNNRLVEWESEPIRTVDSESFEDIEPSPDENTNTFREGVIGLIFVIEDQIYDGFLQFDRMNSVGWPPFGTSAIPDTLQQTRSSIVAPV